MSQLSGLSPENRSGVLVPSALGSLRRPIWTDGQDSITALLQEGGVEVEGRTGELMRLNEGQKRGVSRGVKRVLMRDSEQSFFWKGVDR